MTARTTARVVHDAPPARVRAPRLRGPLRTSAANDALRRCESVLAAQGRCPTPMQRAAFDLVLRGAPGLIVAPTGSGKTVAALLPLLSRLALVEADRRGRLLVLAPVRALCESLREAVAALIEGLDARLRVATRTGDTPARARARLARRPPDVLITTPESLAVLLATDARSALNAVTDVVLDEVHLLAQGKRGALLGATLATLDAHLSSLGGRPARRLGMSATAEPLDALRRWVHPRAELVREAGRGAALSLLVPALDAGFPSAAWAGRSALPSLARAVAASEGATLVFASSRARAERWSLALRDVLPARMGVGCFHGSLSPEERARVTEGLRSGALRVVVATSALEVGVDLPRVSQVILLGAPSSLQRATQAAGRADHRPGVPASAAVLPLSALDLLRACAAREALAEGHADEVPLHDGDLDVLTQALLGRAALAPCDREALAKSVRCAPAFTSTSEADIDEALTFLTTGGDVFAAYPEMARLRVADDRYLLANRRSAVRYLRGVGTIVSELTAMVLHGSSVVGELQGRFASSLDVGDRFALAGRVWRVTGRGAAAVYVRPERHADRALPAWEGGAPSLSPRIAARLERLWGALGEALDRRGDALAVATSALGLSAESAAPVAELLRLQRSCAPLPSPDHLLVELVHDGEVLHVVAHTFAGRGANEVIARALASRARGHDGAEVFASDESAGVILARPASAPDESVLRAWLAPEGLRETLAQSLEQGSFGAASFREVARVTQLWLPDARKGAVTPALLYDVLRRHAPAHLLLRAQRDTLWRALEGPRAEAALRAARDRALTIRAAEHPSPLAIPALASMRRAGIAPDDVESALLDAANAMYLRSLAASP